MSNLRIKGLDYLSPSQVSKLNECQRRWWWERNGVREPGSEATAMGSGLATALEFGDLDAGLRAYDRGRPQFDEWTDPESYKRAEIIAAHTIKEAFDGYMVRWPDPAGTLREQTYLVDIPDEELIITPPTYLQVRTDGIVPGSHFIEDKLRSGSSMRAADIENEVRHGTQLTCEAYTHWRVTGELLTGRLRCVKKIDPRKLKGSATKPVAIEDIPEILAEHFAENESAFQEFEVTRTEADFEALERELAGLAQTARDLKASKMPAGSRNLRSCFSYGRECPVLARCQSGSLTDAIETERLLDLGGAA